MKAALPPRLTAFAAAWLAAGLAAAAPPAANQLPTGGTIVAGTGSIATAGNAMTVTQTTPRMIANWDRFDIGSAASVAFIQPSASAIALNRILSQDPTQIFGRLSSNGQVMLLNPAGIVFGQGSQVNVGALVASTLAISDANFMAGNFAFARDGIAGSVVNQGRIVTPNGGVVAFLAPVVHNAGEIETPRGSTLLAAADKVTIDFVGDGLIAYTLDAGTANALVTNAGSIAVDGGVAVLTAKAADAVARAVVNNSGVVRANALETRGGRIVLNATSRIELAESSVIEADGAQGGDIVIKAEDDWGVSGELVARGVLSAQGRDGRGGFIETSAAKVDIGDVVVRARGGQWLIDPVDVTIQTGGATDVSTGGGYSPASTVDVATLVTALNNDLSVTIDTAGGVGGNGDITVANAIGKTAGGNASLTLNADGSIAVNANITSTSGQLVLSLNAPAGSVGGTGNINTNGGLLTVDAGAGTGTLSGVISGTGGVTKTGAGLLILTGNNTYSGTTTISAGMLGIGDITATGSLGSGAVVNDAMLGFSRTGNVAIANAISGTGALTAMIGGDLTFDNTVSQSTIAAQATGDIALNAALTATGGGTAIELASSTFHNTFGAGALSTPAGNWRVWSGNPAADIRGGLAYNFKQYTATFGITTVLGTGNGFLYTLAPTLTVTLSGVDKPYDGSATAAPAAGNYSYGASVAVAGDAATWTPFTGEAGYGATYDSAAAGSRTVSVANLSFTTTDGAATVYGYRAAPPLTGSGSIVAPVFVPPPTATATTVATTTTGGTTATAPGSGAEALTPAPLLTTSSSTPAATGSASGSSSSGSAATSESTSASSSSSATTSAPSPSAPAPVSGATPGVGAGASAGRGVGGSSVAASVVGARTGGNVVPLGKADVFAKPLVMPGASRVTLLPQADGRPSAVVVFTDSGTVVLDKPYAVAGAEPGGQIAYGETDATAVRALVGATLAAQPAKPTTLVLRFVSGKNELTPESKAALKKLRAELGDRALPEVEVVGHADRRGNARTNDALALGRAQAVRAALIAAGVPPQAVEASGRGASQPLDSASTRQADAVNRRVEVTIR